MYVFISGGGPMAWIQMGLFFMSSLFGLDIGQSLQSLIVLFVAALAVAAYFPSVREAVAATFPPYIRDMIFRGDDDDNNDAPRRARRRGNTTTERDEWDDIAAKIRNTPIESYTKDLTSLSTKELKKRLRNRQVDTRHCVERQELIDLLKKNSRGTSENCIICFEDYEEGDAMRVLSACKHTYHIECIDRWAYAKKSQAKCPMCNTPIS
jgi:hypothetical protein